jgi:hypothetical protein
MVMYNSTDPRASLASAKAGPAATEFAAAEYLRFYDMEPQQNDANGKTWLGRGQNFIIAHSEARPGAAFSRRSQLDEYVVLLPDAKSPATITWEGRTETVSGYSIAFVPPGDSTVAMPEGGRLVRMFTTRSEDLARMPTPMPRTIRTSRRSSRGPTRRVDTGCAAIRSTYRTSRGVSAVSGAARRSW